MVWNKRKLKTAVVACLVALTLATNDFSFAEVIGDSASVPPILLQIAPFLDEEAHIDVFGSNAPAPGKRPRVGLMSHFNHDISLRAIAYKKLPRLALKAWMEGFNQGMFGRIGFLSEPASTATKASEEQFRSAWDRAPEGQRVFI